MGDRRGKNTVQITGVKGSALPCPCQRQATGCSNPVKPKLSEGRVSELLKIFDSHQVSWLLFCKSRLATLNSSQPVLGTGFHCLFFLPPPTYEGTSRHSWTEHWERIWGEYQAFPILDRALLDRDELLQQSSFSWRNPPGDEAARSLMGCLHPGIAHGLKTKWSKVPSRPWALHACAHQP